MEEKSWEHSFDDLLHILKEVAIMSNKASKKRRKMDVFLEGLSERLNKIIVRCPKRKGSK